MKCVPLNRYFWLLNLIYSTGGISRSQINEQWRKSRMNENNDNEIPESTFNHWKNMIYREWGLEIRYSRSRNQYYIDDGYATGENRFFNWMMHSISVAELIRFSADMRDRILLEPMPGGERWLAPLIEAMRNSRVLDMEYKRFDVAEGHYMEFKPYCLKTFKQRWYVVGESSDHPGEIRVYALDRINNLIESDKSFHLPKSFNGKKLFQDLYGVWLGTKLKTELVRVRVRASEANYLRTLPLHHSQTENGPAKRGWIEFQWKIKPTYDFIMELRSHGKTLEVLEPEWVKLEV